MYGWVGTCGGVGMRCEGGERGCEVLMGGKGEGWRGRISGEIVREFFGHIPLSFSPLGIRV